MTLHGKNNEDSIFLWKWKEQWGLCENESEFRSLSFHKNGKSGLCPPMKGVILWG